MILCHCYFLYAIFLKKQRRGLCILMKDNLDPYECHI